MTGNDLSAHCGSLCFVILIFIISKCYSPCCFYNRDFFFLRTPSQWIFCQRTCFLHTHKYKHAHAHTQTEVARETFWWGRNIVMFLQMGNCRPHPIATFLSHHWKKQGVHTLAGRISLVGSRDNLSAPSQACQESTLFL